MWLIAILESISSTNYPCLDKIDNSRLYKQPYMKFQIFTQVGFIWTMFNWNIISCLIAILLVKRNAGDFRTHPNWPKHVDEICGESNHDRIIGGENASLGQFPWMVRLVYFYRGKLRLQKHIIVIFDWIEWFCRDEFTRRQLRRYSNLWSVCSISGALLRKFPFFTVSIQIGPW